MGKIQIMCNKRFISGILSVSLGLFVHLPLQAGIYKWVDESGQIHYGEQPGNSDAKKVAIRKNETTKPRTINKTENGTSQSDKDKTGQQAEAPLVEVEPSKQEKRKYCNEAKSDLAAIANRGRMREVNAKGEYSYLTEKQKQQRIAAAKKKQREFCR